MFDSLYLVIPGPQESLGTQAMAVVLVEKLIGCFWDLDASRSRFSSSAVSRAAGQVVLGGFLLDPASSGLLFHSHHPSFTPWSPAFALCVYTSLHPTHP